MSWDILWERYLFSHLSLAKFCIRVAKLGSKNLQVRTEAMYVTIIYSTVGLLYSTQSLTVQTQTNFPQDPCCILFIGGSAVI